MDSTGSSPPGRPRIERLKVQNFRALRNVELKDLKPMTALLGPNGSGKSTIFDVFAFLADCFQRGLRPAWDKRGRGRELKSRGTQDPVMIEIKYRERPRRPLITYHLAVDEQNGVPRVVEEWLSWRRGQRGKPFRFLDYRGGQGRAVSGEDPDESAERVEIPLNAPDLLAVNALGQFADHPRVAALRDFITGWHVSYLSSDSARGQPEAGPQERLSRSGDNLANVTVPRAASNTWPSSTTSGWSGSSVSSASGCPVSSACWRKPCRTAACSCSSRMPRSATR